MLAVIFEEKNDWRTDLYLLKGETAHEIFLKVQDIQNLDCLKWMGYDQGTKKDKLELVKLDEFINADYYERITLDDFKNFDLQLSIGSMRFPAVAENKEEIKQLRKAYPDAFVR